jgi:hypothetical protein
MNKIHLVMTVFAIATTSIIADTKQPVKKSEQALEGTVETRNGELEFINGYPMDFRRAVQAYLWGLPLVEMAEWQKAQKDILKAGPNAFA